MNDSTTTARLRYLSAPITFLISIPAFDPALAFDAGGLRYTATSGTEAEVTGFATGNSPTTIAIPVSACDSGAAACYSVTSIKREAFANSQLQSVTIGALVTTIGDSAFSECPQLSSVTLGNKVETIGEGAFEETPLLTSVTIPESVVTIKQSAFNNSNLASLIIPDGVVTIETLAFKDNVITTSL